MDAAGPFPTCHQKWARVYQITRVTLFEDRSRITRRHDSVKPQRLGFREMPSSCMLKAVDVLPTLHWCLTSPPCTLDCLAVLHWD
jgi:hypothetical protein